MGAEIIMLLLPLGSHSVKMMDEYVTTLADQDCRPSCEDQRHLGQI